MGFALSASNEKNSEMLAWWVPYWLDMNQPIGRQNLQMAFFSSIYFPDFNIGTDDNIDTEVLACMAEL